MSTDIDMACEQLVKALRDHAAVVLSQGSDSSAMAASAGQELRSAVRSYADAIFEATGWGNVFADIHEDEDEEDEETLPEPEEVQRLSVMGRWDFLVEDPNALMRHAYHRLIESGWDEQAAAEHSESPSAALDSLSALDGWDVRRYIDQGAKTAGYGWTVRHVDKTLWEMSHTERWDAGF
ncbi:hypothetical protein [Nonomuraea sp. bgisy101]|uniref:hypothetical protein n=1 Tax=Nonomuraea sp. bgisy101 TaxID=3413784 RepID=UPI003D734E8C